MKVLHVQRSTGIAGSEGHLLTLLPELADRGMHVRMCVLDAGGAVRFGESLESLGIHASSIPSRRDVGPLVFARLAREMRDWRPDLVHTHLIHADTYGLAAARATGTPAVRSLHNMHRFYLREPMRGIARVIARLPRRTIAISTAVARFASEARIARPGTLRVIYYGIDVDRWTVGEDVRKSTRASFGLDDNDVCVGVASRLIPGKGHEFLIQAMCSALERAPSLRLIVAGDGPSRRHLERAGRNILKERVRFCGQVVDVAAFMSACDLVALPTEASLGEGFGLAALEGMAAGKPVVATAVGALPEVVEDGVTGELVSPGATGELADVLVRWSVNARLRDILGSAGRERAIQCFSIRAMADATTAVYEEALANDPSASASS